MNATMTAHAHARMVTANTLPKNTPSLCQISVIFINPFKTRKISNADMTIIAIMNRVKPHYTSQIAHRVVGTTVRMPVVKFFFAKSALESRIIE